MPALPPFLRKIPGKSGGAIGSSGSRPDQQETSTASVPSTLTPWQILQRRRAITDYYLAFSDGNLSTSDGGTFRLALNLTRGHLIFGLVECLEASHFVGTFVPFF